MACDICGNNKEALVPLLDIYQTDKIRQICPACEDIVNKKNRDLLSLVLKIEADLVKRFLQQRREEKNG